MSAQEIAALLVAAGTLVSSLASLVVAIRTGQKTDRTHELVNGQSAIVQGLAEAKGHAEGKLEGQPGVVGKIPTGK